VKINYGIKTGCNEAFIIDAAKRNEILENCASAEERKRTVEIIRPILRGRDIKRYAYEWANLHIIATFPALHIDIKEYPAVEKHLLSFDKERLVKERMNHLTTEPFLAQWCMSRLEEIGESHKISGTKVSSRKKTRNKWFETQDQIAYWVI
jgi:adenine-specific DNA-methyltransferase